MKKSMFLILLSLFSVAAFAQTAPTQGVLDSMLAQFLNASGGQMLISQGFAKQIFGSLIVFDLTLFAIRKLPSAGDISDLLGGIALKVFSWGFFYTLIVMGPQWVPLITQSFMQIGTKIGGGSQLITPSGIMDLAVSAAAAIWNSYTANSSWVNIGSNIVLGLAIVVAVLVTVIAFALVAFQLIATQIELIMASSIGFFLLGFSGASFTTMFSEKYFGYIVSAGIKLVMVCALAGFGTTLSQQFVVFISSHNGEPISSVTLLVATIPMIIYGSLALQLPAIAGSLMNGAPSMSAGGIAGGAAAIAGGVAGAAMAGAGLAAGAAGAGGSAANFARDSLDKLSVLTGGGGDVRSTMGDNFDRLANLSSGGGSTGELDSIASPGPSSFSPSSDSGQSSTLKDGLGKMSDAQSQMSQHEGGGGGISIRLNHLGD